MASECEPNTDYDLVVIGGAFSGAAASILLKRRLPSARVLIIEPRTQFHRGVGEATVEVSARFLLGTLGLADLLEHEHLDKHGLRFWFTDEQARPLREMSEVGPDEVPSIPSFQLDRAKLDRRLLDIAKSEGCATACPGRALEVETSWPTSRVRFSDSEGLQRSVSTRWVIDASGRHGFLAKRRGLRSNVEDHPTAALWARWSGVHDLDAPPNSLPPEARLQPLSVSRRLATNHFCGYGWWAWMIPLSSGETSLGLVYDKRLFRLPGQGPLHLRLEAFLRAQDGLRDLLAKAEMSSTDYMAFGHLPYRTSAYAGLGWALVGDAASFTDPFYSPGLDHAAMSIQATLNLIVEDLEGALSGVTLEQRLQEHNRNFVRSYQRWLDALYTDKYEIFGDAELTAISFLVDTALYYIGVLTPILKDPSALADPMFGLPIPQTRGAAFVMKAFKGRLVRLARRRRLQGTYGRRNVAWRRYAPAFKQGWRSIPHLIRGLALWLKLEVETAIHPIALWRHKRTAPRPVETPPKPSGT